MLFALSMRHKSNLERSCARVSRAYESENWKSVRLSFSSQVFPGGAGEGSAGAGVVPSRARRLASIAHPVARRAGLSKFKEFASRSCRARVQAQAGTKAWTDQASTGLSGQHTSAAERAACGLTNARASEPSSSLGKQFKQNRSGGAPKGAFRCSDFSQRRRGRGRTRVCYALDPRDPT